VITQSRDDADFNTALTLAFKVVITMSDLDPVYQTPGRTASAYPNPWSEDDYREFVSLGGTANAWRITENALRREGVVNLDLVRVRTEDGTVDPFEKARAVWVLCPLAERGEAMQVWVLDHLRDEASRWFWQLFTREDARTLYDDGLGPLWMSENEEMKKKTAQLLRDGGIFAFGLFVFLAVEIEKAILRRKTGDAGISV
jgi:hypothetical protein